MARKKAAMPADIAKGIARISSGLYIVTAAQGEARSAMVASWVSQVRRRGCTVPCLPLSLLGTLYGGVAARYPAWRCCCSVPCCRALDEF